MTQAQFLNEMKNGPEILPDEPVFKSIWNEYERVIIHSLITSFGLDFLIADQYGGDVDTIHNVRKIEIDKEMKYKNVRNESEYCSHGAYSTAEYHSDPAFAKIKHDARELFQEKGLLQEDIYVPGNMLLLRNKSTTEGTRRANLEHIISAKEVHDDRGRVLSGLTGLELANSKDNLGFTNEIINKEKGSKTAEEYIEYKRNKGEPLPREIEEKIRKEDNRAREAYETKLAYNYYTSSEFAKDVGVASAKRGAQMAIRQALGFVFLEIWIATKEELNKQSDATTLELLLDCVQIGIKKGVENAKKNNKDLINQIEEGFVSGALASLTTTLCNIFFTTAKSLVRGIRQTYASVIQAGKVLLINPDDLYLGDRIKSTTVILATGASVLVGTGVSEAIGKTSIGCTPVIGGIVQAFCGTFVSSILSCTLLLFLDRNKYINYIIYALNDIPTETNNYKEIADAFEQLAAKVADIDIEQFHDDTKRFNEIALALSNTNNEIEINEVLQLAFSKLKLEYPWDGDFDEFMGNSENRLVFK